MARVGWIQQDGPLDFRVGADDPESMKTAYPYYGTSAVVSADDTWLRIVIDEYEGSAMLNIEALQCLIEALTKIKAERDRNLVLE